MSRRKVSAAEKSQAVLEYLIRRSNQGFIAQKYGVTKSSLRKWIGKYKAFGDAAFIRTGHYLKYRCDGCTRLSRNPAYIAEKISYKRGTRSGNYRLYGLLCKQSSATRSGITNTKGISRNVISFIKMPPS